MDANNLIPVEERTIQGVQHLTVVATDLHAFLQPKTRFWDWISRRIQKYGFVEGIDFEVSLKKELNPDGGRPSRDFILTLDMAKELAMVENNSQGRQIRRHFIECERELIERRTAASQLPMPMPVAKVDTQTVIAATISGAKKAFCKLTNELAQRLTAAFDQQRADLKDMRKEIVGAFDDVAAYDVRAYRKLNAIHAEVQQVRDEVEARQELVLRSILALAKSQQRLADLIERRIG